MSNLGVAEDPHIAKFLVSTWQTLADIINPDCNVISTSKLEEDLRTWMVNRLLINPELTALGIRTKQQVQSSPFNAYDYFTIIQIVEAAVVKHLPSNVEAEHRSDERMIVKAKLNELLADCEPAKHLPRYKTTAACTKCGSGDFVIVDFSQLRRPDEPAAVRYKCTNKASHAEDYVFKPKDDDE